ncbi:hypothetical protein AAMO2058_000836900 [Amorphochlora amoebiformis]|mmetsp:Transcript_1214/g.1683  ORF Transcript_1214/g.1683 Transcript_1214/m.1683 type:complete len:345 (-) Transcript_1214:98-1132(-)
MSWKGSKAGDEDSVVEADGKCCCARQCESFFFWCERCRSDNFDACCDRCEETGFSQWISCCPETTRDKAYWFQVFCVIMLIASCLITLTGRGLLSVIQGVLGMIFAVEGLTGFTTLRLDVVKRFRVLLFLYLVASICIGIINLLSIDQYCETAEDINRCRTQAEISAYILLGVGLPTLVLFFCFVLRYIGQRDKSGSLIYQDRIQNLPKSKDLKSPDEGKHGVRGTHRRNGSLAHTRQTTGTGMGMFVTTTTKILDKLEMKPIDVKHYPRFSSSKNFQNDIMPNSGWDREPLRSSPGMHMYQASQKSQKMFQNEYPNGQYGNITMGEIKRGKLDGIGLYEVEEP